MIKIRILSVGKNKDRWLEEGLQEYARRLSALATFEYIWAKDDAHLAKLLEREKRFICLDLAGEELTSVGFAAFFFREVQAGGSSLAFAIGGPDGLPPSIKANRTLLCLSRLTFTHQMARLILMEQIFRSFEIERGSQYHR